MITQHLLSAVIIIIGLWFGIRGILLKSGPRVLSGLGIIAVGCGHYFGQRSMAGTTLFAIGLMLIVGSFYWMKTQSGRVIRPAQPRRRRRR